MDVSNFDKAANATRSRAPFMSFPQKDLNGEVTLPTVNVRYEYSDEEDDKHSNRQDMSSHSPSPSPPAKTFERKMSYTDPSIEDLVDSNVSEFMKSLQEPKYAHPLTGEEISELFQTFYRKVEDELEPPTGELISQPELRQLRKRNSRVLDQIERRITTTLYPKLMENSQGRDPTCAERFEQRLEIFRSTPALLDMLDLGVDVNVRASLEPVSAHLANLDKAKTPQDKIRCVVMAHKMIVEILKDDSSSSADSILPLLVYCVLASPTSNIWRHTTFMRRFRREHAIKGQAGYCLTNMEAAVQYLDTVSFPQDQLPAHIDSTLFAMPTAALSSPIRSRSNSSARSRSDSETRSPRHSVPSRIGTVGASVSKYLISKLGTSQTVSDFKRALESDTTSVSTGDADSALGLAGGRPPIPNPKFLNVDADNLTLGDVKSLLAEYRVMAAYVQGQQPTDQNSEFSCTIDDK